MAKKKVIDAWYLQYEMLKRFFPKDDAHAEDNFILANKLVFALNIIHDAGEITSRTEAELEAMVKKTFFVKW